VKISFLLLFAFMSFCLDVSQKNRTCTSTSVKAKRHKSWELNFMLEECLSYSSKCQKNFTKTTTKFINLDEWWPTCLAIGPNFSNKDLGEPKKKYFI
jgi:hypothetical protein